MTAPVPPDEDRQEERVGPAVDRLSRAVHQTGRLVDGVTEQQWAAPTPCPDWAVRDLVAHLVTGQRLTAGTLTGQPPGALGPVPDHELPSAYRSSAVDLLEAFAVPGALERELVVPFGVVTGAVALHLRLVEALVHGWDLARATGTELQVPDDVVPVALAFTQQMLGEIPPDRRPFAAPVPVPAAAPPLDQLAGLLGRAAG